LEGDFAVDFFEAVKADFESGGKAYATVTLRFFGEILMEVRGLGANQAELSKQNQETLKNLLEILPKLEGVMKQLAEATAWIQKLNRRPAMLKAGGDPGTAPIPLTAVLSGAREFRALVELLLARIFQDYRVS